MPIAFVPAMPIALGDANCFYTYVSFASLLGSTPSVGEQWLAMAFAAFNEAVAEWAMAAGAVADSEEQQSEIELPSWVYCDEEVQDEGEGYKPELLPEVADAYKEEVEDEKEMKVEEEEMKDEEEEEEEKEEADRLEPEESSLHFSAWQDQQLQKLAHEERRKAIDKVAEDLEMQEHQQRIAVERFEQRQQQLDFAKQQQELEMQQVHQQRMLQQQQKQRQQQQSEEPKAKIQKTCPAPPEVYLKALREERAAAEALGLDWQHRGPPGPSMGGPSTWRGQKYRENSGKWANRGGNAPWQSFDHHYQCCHNHRHHHRHHHYHHHDHHQYQYHHR